MELDILNKDISDLFGLEDAPQEEKEAMLAEIGDVILESSLLRLSTELNEEQSAALEHYLEANDDSETILKYLLTQHTEFQKIFEEEVLAFKEDAIAVLKE